MFLYVEIELIKTYFEKVDEISKVVYSVYKNRTLLRPPHYILLLCYKKLFESQWIIVVTLIIHNTVKTMRNNTLIKQQKTKFGSMNTSTSVYGTFWIHTGIVIHRYVDWVSRSNFVRESNLINSLWNVINFVHWWIHSLFGSFK